MIKINLKYFINSLKKIKKKLNKKLKQLIFKNNIMGSEICICCKTNNSISTKVFTLPDKQYTKTISISNSQEQISKYSTYNGSTIGKNKTLKFDKSTFVRMKSKNLFDEYELKEKLGEGAFGFVYKIEQKKTQFLRAVKAIKRKHVDSNFINEIKILKTVDHPNIIKLFDCYYDNNYYYMIEEYCSGGDLFDYLHRQKYFSEKKASIILKQLLSAVNHLHKKKIVHRDLKPENIVFIKTQFDSDDLFIKLIDFGTSTSTKNGNLTQEIGTIYYIAPEVFKNNYNEKADIWSIGIIFYTLICGHPPFRGRREDIIKIKILNYNISFPSNNFRNMSQSGINLLKKLLEPDYNKRISAEEALNDEWFVKMENKVDDEIEINNLGNSICKNLEQFKNTVCLQKLILSFLTNQTTFHDEIKRLKEEFDRIDENKDGEISKDELIKCLETIHPNGEAKIKANEIFNEIDFNHDGTINFSEYLTLTMEKEKLINEDMLKKTFKLFDIDGNGYITIDELKEIMPLDLINNSGWLDLVKEVDQDGDCQISYNEFKQMMLKVALI